MVRSETSSLLLIPLFVNDYFVMEISIFASRTSRMHIWKLIWTTVGRNERPQWNHLKRRWNCINAFCTFKSCCKTFKISIASRDLVLITSHHWWVSVPLLHPWFTLSAIQLRTQTYEASCRSNDRHDASYVWIHSRCVIVIRCKNG